ncbi:MAG: hypothetical protein A2X67_13925 [Ignavibacteria bacterium GWA2_55_11]|nr:MAG: hypothetical protein A2X67_13925 [Ignavibacteria bacterium GWA2_55_11]OGU43312.1 MAG: hypothetical protein A2X68_04550 [Ignavibacteria bacterium GWC2_56_12]OGU63151.1 MAG: hypothetical protein A3C56_06450 [Ignavibacteria bacterium RIFCSPHIGHO2_02_FULL_56_12]OGU70582.1 MAG: hypothetical protein A3G43_06695 [Ignavibacteria bacterium RIFCSPLOWO2_12_FULL_56_21]
MSDSVGTAPVLRQLVDVLQQELALLNGGRRSMTMFHGERVGAFAGRTYYRFEIPEDILLRTIESATFTFGRVRPIAVAGNIITIENQFLIVALPHDFGQSLPEVQASWDYEPQFAPVIDALRAIPATAPVPKILLHPSDASNTHVVPFEPVVLPNTPPDQVQALEKILRNRVSLLWGPILSGKTRVVAHVIANYLKAGKKVLFVAPANDQVDSTVMRAVDVGTQLGVDMQATSARYDLPSLEASDVIAPYSFEQQVEAAKEEKRKVFQERVVLLKTFWNAKARQILHEDFYKRTQEMREKVAVLRKQTDAASKELTHLQQNFSSIQNASVFDKMKKGFSKDDLAAAQKAYADKQQHVKRLQQLQQALSSEITRIELDAPISAAEMKSFNEAAKRIEELGGADQVAKAVEEFTAIDETAMLKGKHFVATSVATAFMDPVLRSQQYDLVIVDEAQAVNIPTLVALASLAKEKMVVAGDPFQLEPDTPLNTEAGRTWLQRDIYLFVAGTDQLNRLFDWAEKNRQWSILLSSHFATTPKLSLFVGSVVFDDKITVFASPKSRGRIFFIDTSSDNTRCRQYAGRKKILPYNEEHTKKAVACVKHAFVEGKRNAGDIGVILPFSGPTLYTKLQLRMEGMRSVEVGTPQTFRGRRKKSIVFDTTMAGVDHTVRHIDDRKAGEHKIVRLFNTVFSCVEDDLYIIADLGHFRTVYPERLFTRFLMLLQAEADQKQPNFANAVRTFDLWDARTRAAVFSAEHAVTGEPAAASTAKEAPPLTSEKQDVEFKMQMQMMAKKEPVKPAGGQAQQQEQAVWREAERVLALRTDINLLSQYTGGDMLFRNTFATEQAAARLPGDAVQSEKDFRAVMERWNLLIYEMSGGNKSEHPLLTHKGPESRPRYEVRHLSAFFSSDIGAMIEEGKSKIAAEVNRVFQELLGKPQPGNPAEWHTAYVGFLGRLEKYLGWVSEQIRK